MPDITMCKGDNSDTNKAEPLKVCPLKNKCYRHLAPVAPFYEAYQSYFVDLPYDFDDVSCEHFWDVNDSPNVP